MPAAPNRTVAWVALGVAGAASLALVLGHRLSKRAVATPPPVTRRQAEALRYALEHRGRVAVGPGKAEWASTGALPVLQRLEQRGLVEFQGRGLLVTGRRGGGGERFFFRITDAGRRVAEGI
jgi:hypothetical protein